MAAFRAAASAGNGQSTVVTSLDIVIPASAEEDDAAVLVVEIQQTSRAVTTPSGWALLSGPDAPGGSSEGESYVYTRQLQAGDADDTVTLTITGGFTRALAHMLVFSDADVAGVDFDLSIDTSGTSSIPTPILTDVPDGAAVICLLSRRRGGTPAPSLTLPSGGGYTSSGEIATSFDSSPELCMEGGYRIVDSTGTYGGEFAASATNTHGTSYLIALPSTSSITDWTENPADGLGLADSAQAVLDTSITVEDGLGLGDARALAQGKALADALALTDLGQQEHPPHRASTVVLATSGLSIAALESDGLSTAVIATS